jgi:hypothetical protein
MGSGEKETCGDMAAFLSARLDEAEATAHHAGPALVAWLTVRRDGGELAYTTVAAGGEGDFDPWVADGREIPEPASVRVVYDPARALREVTAMRAILGAHQITVTRREVYPFDRWTGEPNPDEHDGQCEACGWFDPEHGGCMTLRHLTAIWCTHPEYEASWAP